MDAENFLIFVSRIAFTKTQALQTVKSNCCSRIKKTGFCCSLFSVGSLICQYLGCIIVEESVSVCSPPDIFSTWHGDNKS